MMVHDKQLIFVNSVLSEISENQRKTCRPSNCAGITRKPDFVVESIADFGIECWGAW